jgi:hypothetical protein
VLAFEQLVATEVIDRAMFGRGHQPCAGVAGDARVRPLLQGGHQCVVREILCETDVAHHSHEPCNDLGGLNPPDGVNRAMGVGGRHGPILNGVRPSFYVFRKSESATPAIYEKRKKRV